MSDKVRTPAQPTVVRTLGGSRETVKGGKVNCQWPPKKTLGVK